MRRNPITEMIYGTEAFEDAGIKQDQRFRVRNIGEPGTFLEALDTAKEVDLQ